VEAVGTACGNSVVGSDSALALHVVLEPEILQAVPVEPDSRKRMPILG